MALIWIGQAQADEKPAEKEATPLGHESARAYVRRDESKSPMLKKLSLE